MKYILLFITIFSFYAASAQDGYYLTKEQHEQIKKNLKDYKTLIYNFDEQKRKLAELVAQFEFTRKMYAERDAELAKVKRENIDIHNLEIKIENLENDKKALNERIASMQREMDYKNKSLNTYKSKYLKEYTSNRGDRIIANSIWATFVVCGMWAIYTSYEANYLH